MSFFGKFKSGGGSGSQAGGAQSKKDVAPELTALEKHLKDATGPVRPDGSDKFFGFENYGSTCYANSVIQCLYYSAPFRENVMNFPPRHYLDNLTQTTSNGAPFPPRSTSQIPYPNATSPARKEYVPPTSPGGTQPKEESKDSPEYKKRQAIKSGPVLDMIHDRSNGYGMDESLFTALKDIFDAIKTNNARHGIVSPHKFLEILRRENEMFRSAMHQDAHEFLNLLLNQVVDSVEMFSKSHPSLSNGAASNGGVVAANATSLVHGAKTSTNGLDTHWVHDLFEGLLTSETRCLTCENTSQRDEPFLDLSVDLSAHTSVTSCLRKFSEEEMLCERNKFHCDNCGGLQEAEKRMKIKRLPRVLALHLKRFKYTEDLQRLQKLFHRVVYPFHLRLFNTTDDATDPDRLYELYAVVVHIGGGPYHGHYVSIVKTQDRGWLLFDDELVEPVDKTYVQSFFGGEPVPGLQDARQLACAYVLFYQETTLEAVLREQEAETQQQQEAAAAAANTSRTSDVDPSSSSAAAGLYHAHTNATTLASPGLSEAGDPMLARNSMDPLAHSHTAPSVSAAAVAAAAPPQMASLDSHVVNASTLSPSDPTSSPLPNAPMTAFPNSSTTPPTNLPTSPSPPGVGTGSVKSKKEQKQDKAQLKQEEKARKAAAKAEAKALDEKRRQASARRMESWRKNQEEMNAAIEASKVTAREEAKSRGTGDAAAAGENGTVGDAGGTGSGVGSALGRFTRHSSMNLRAKPRWMGGSSGNTASMTTTTTPTAPSAGTATNTTTAATTTNGGAVSRSFDNPTTLSLREEAEEEEVDQPLSAATYGNEQAIEDESVTAALLPTTSTSDPNTINVNRNSAFAAIPASSAPAASGVVGNGGVAGTAGSEEKGGVGSTSRTLKHRFSLGRKKSQAISHS